MYTTFTDHFKDCIDYLFVSTDITVKHIDNIDQRIKIITNNGNDVMPNSHYPSDHIDITAEIQF